MNKKSLWVIRGSVLVLAVAFLVLGTVRGEPMEVLQKATSICLQCIGIG